MGGGGSKTKTTKSSGGGKGSYVKLEGSKKQIAWAEDIRKLANEALDDVAKSAKAQPNKEQSKDALEKVERMRKVINSTKESGALIEVFSGYTSGRTGEDAKRSAISAMTSFRRYAASAKELEEMSSLVSAGKLRANLKRAWDGKQPRKHPQKKHSVYVKKEGG